jgi:hypothetical protein
VKRSYVPYNLSIDDYHTTSVIVEAVSVAPLLICISIRIQHDSLASSSQKEGLACKSRHFSALRTRLIRLWCVIFWVHDDFRSYWWRLHTHPSPSRCEEHLGSRWISVYLSFTSRTDDPALTNNSSHVSTPTQVSKVLISASPIGTFFWPMILEIDRGK